MFEKEKCTIVTNNDRVADKYKDIMKVELVNSYEEVLIKARDCLLYTSQSLYHKIQEFQASFLNVL